MKDLVIDANILGHSGNPADKFHQASCAALQSIEAAAVDIYIDADVNIFDLLSTSRMAVEYRAHTPPGSLAYNFLFSMANTSRVRAIEESCYNTHKTKIRKLITTNTTDVIVLAVTIETEDKMLVSNDYSDFKPLYRKLAKKHFSVTIIDAEECAEHIV